MVVDSKRRYVYGNLMAIQNALSVHFIESEITGPTDIDKNKKKESDSDPDGDDKEWPVLGKKKYKST